MSGSDLVDQSGRTLGPRALQTRQRLLDATVKLLAEERLRDLRVIDIARKVGASPATFYQYFRHVEDAVLALAEQASEEMPGIMELVAGSWEGEAGLQKARAIVDAFIRHWDEHQAVLRVRNLASDEGDDRFGAVRRKTMAPVIEELSRLIVAQGGEVGRRGSAPAAAAALAAILERLAAYHRELEAFGVTREDLVSTSALIIHRTITGR